MYKPQLPAALTDLGQSRNGQSRVRQILVVGGGIIGGLGVLIALIAAWHKNQRYTTGYAKLVSLTEETGWFRVTMDDGATFWAPATVDGELLKTYHHEGAPLMPYRIDRREPTKEGLPFGTIDPTS